MPTIEEQQATVQAQLDALQARPDIAMPTMARGSPADGTRPGWLSLFGEALGGGQGSGYRLRGREEDAAGSRALLNFGINMLLASGPSRVRPDLLSAAATGLQGAQQSLGADQQQAQAQAAADYKERLDAAKFGLDQDHSKIERIKAALPLLQLQQQLHQLGQPLPPALGGPPVAGGPQAAADLPTDKAAALKAIAQRESGGNPTLLNYVAEQDPTAYARGATASGKYQIVNSTWREGLQLAGLDPSKYATARAAPEAVQDQVASVLWDKYGNKPWQKGAKDWVKDERGQYQLATVRPSAGSPGAPAPAPAPTAAVPPRQPLPPPTADVAPTGVQVSGPAGVASPGPATPPSPAVAGDVNAIIAGMTGAGADATTLAPGGGGAAPGVAVAQAGPPAAQPSATPSPAQEFDAYVKQNLRGGPDLTELERARDIAKWQVGQAGTLPERAAAAKEVIAAEKNIADAKTAWLKDQRAELFKVWDADRTATRTQRDEIEKEARAQQRAIELKEFEGREARYNNAQAADIARQEKRMEKLDESAGAAKSSVDDLQFLRALSDNVGKADPWSQIMIGGIKAGDWITKFNLGTPEFTAKMGAQQAYEAAMYKIVGGIKAGISLGNTSDRDLDFIKSQVPGLMVDPVARGNMVGFLEQVYQRKVDYHRLTSEYYKPGTTSVFEAEKRADKELGPLLKTPPAFSDLSGEAKAQAQRLWIYQNVVPGTFYKNRDGKLVPYNPPAGWKPAGVE